MAELGLTYEPGPAGIIAVDLCDGRRPHGGVEVLPLVEAVTTVEEPIDCSPEHTVCRIGCGHSTFVERNRRPTRSIEAKKLAIAKGDEAANIESVKAAAPDITLVGLGGEHSDHHFENIRGMLAAGSAKAMDAFSIHCYRYPRTPEESDLFGEIQKVAALAKEHGAPTKAWVTEIGWPTHSDARGVDERTQARIFVRTMALLRSLEAVEKVHWYDFKDDGSYKHVQLDVTKSAGDFGDFTLSLSKADDDDLGIDEDTLVFVSWAKTFD